MKICIDDERTISDADEHYRTAKDGLYRVVQALLRGETIDVLYLDHDLGDDNDSRLIATFIGWASRIDHDFVSEVIVHSMNPSASEGIVQFLRASNVKVSRGVIT